MKTNNLKRERDDDSEVNSPKKSREDGSSSSSSSSFDERMPLWLKPLTDLTETSNTKLQDAAFNLGLQIKPRFPMTAAPALRVTVPRIAGLQKAKENETYSYVYYDGQDKTQAYPNIPGYCQLPLRESFDLTKLFRLGGDILVRSLQLYYTHYRLSNFDDWSHPQRYADFFDGGGWLDSKLALPLPQLSHTWQGDSVWASQFLQGTNPTLIRLVNEASCATDEIPGAKKGQLPSEFNLSNDFRTQVQKITGKSLEDLVLKQNLFVVDHKILKGCPVEQGRVLYAPISLFYVDGSGTLQPLCIQLRSGNYQSIHEQLGPDVPPVATDDKKLYYPDSGPDSKVWQLAKMLVSHSDANYHEAITHLGFCHLLMEAIVIAAHRTFDVNHPLYRFLIPHFHGTLWINDAGRSSLISPKQDTPFSFDDTATIGVKGALHLINKAFSEFNFIRDCSLPKALEYRGVMNPEVLPIGYYYRDYGLRVWKCMEKYVESVVEKIYKTDNKVAEDGRIQLDTDGQLQQFLQTVKESGRISVFPTQINRKEDLVELITTILWTASGQHAAVNFPQYDYYAFLPAKPLIMTRPMPESPAEVTWKYVTKALAGKVNTLETIVLLKALTQQSAEDYHIETEADHPFLGFLKLDKVEFPDQYRDFVSQLAEEEVEMRRLNDEQGSNYHYLYPSEIPASTSI